MKVLNAPTEVMLDLKSTEVLLGVIRVTRFKYRAPKQEARNECGIRPQER